jgi:hypothetical protein
MKVTVIDTVAPAASRELAAVVVDTPLIVVRTGAGVGAGVLNT